MRRTAIVLLATCCLALLGGVAGAQSETATVTLVHGFRGLVADVYLDGERILEGFRPERSTDPTELPAGEHQVAVRTADTPPDSAPLLEDTLDLPAGGNLSAVVHPDANGDPTISVFDNEFAVPGDNEARVVVRHTARAPAIDVNVGDTTVAEGLEQGQQNDDVVPPGADEITTFDASSSEQLLAPTRISAGPNVVVAVYLIGATDDDTLGWLSQRLDTGTRTMPLGVPTGNSGLVATPAVPWWAWTAAALAALTAARGVRAVRQTARSGR